MTDEWPAQLEGTTPAERGIGRVGSSRRIQVVVGRELRRLRHKLDWTTTVMTERLAAFGHHIEAQTVGAYERGDRAMTVDRLAAFCFALGVRPTVFWSIVDERMFGTGREGGIEVDVRKVAALDNPDLAPARAWARVQLHHGGPTVVITYPAIRILATLCHLDVADVCATLLTTKAELDGRDTRSSR
jgi:transcriptional regulator with XRE-family HTH domain